MSPDVTKRKIALIVQYLDDLARYRGISYDDYLKNRYAIERILELVVMTAADLVFHLLAAREESTPVSYGSAFLRAGETGLIKVELAERLAKAAGMRNVLAHGYETIDHRLIHQSVGQTLSDFTEFTRQIEKTMEI